MLSTYSPAATNPSLAQYNDNYGIQKMNVENIKELTGFKGDVNELMDSVKTELGIGKSEMDGIWQSLSEYIDQNLDSRLTLAALAEKCFYNPSYFSRIFKEKFGVSLTEYITRKRLSHAIMLLSESVLSVEEIRECVGFPDKNSLYHAFSRYLGTTPGEYRRTR